MCLLNPQSHPCLPVGDSLGTRRRHHLDEYSICKLALAMQEHPYFNSGITIIATITTVNFLHPTQWKFHCPSERGLRPTHTTIQTQNSMDLTFLASIHTSHSALDGTFGTQSPAHKRESTTRCNEERWKAEDISLAWNHSSSNCQIQFLVDLLTLIVCTSKGGNHSLPCHRRHRCWQFCRAVLHSL